MVTLDNWSWTGLSAQTLTTNTVQTTSPQPAKPVKLKKSKTLEEMLKEQEEYLNKIYGQKRSADRYSDPEIYI